MSLSDTEYYSGELSSIHRWNMCRVRSTVSSNQDASVVPMVWYRVGLYYQTKQIMKTRACAIAL